MPRMPGGVERSFAWWLRALAFLATLALLAAACGDDDDDDDGAASDTAPATGDVATDTSGPTETSDGETTEPADDTTTTEAPEEEPIVGGEATVLQLSEVAVLDAVRATGASGTDGLRMFSIYGAIVVHNPDSGELTNVFAESFEPGDDLSTWTLVLHDGITFTDGTPLDAAAVKANWERILVPDNRSPAFGYASQIASTTVVDDLTLEIALTAPNAHFPLAVSRTALNYLASPTAFAAGHDLANDPIGAGPFVVREWMRDDRLVLDRNPDYFDAPRPYLDTITIRVVPDPDQRVDTFLTGDGDAVYLQSAGVERAREDTPDGQWVGTVVSAGTVLMFNTQLAPYDDVRVRRGIAMGYDRVALSDIVYGTDYSASSYTPDDGPFHVEDAAVPAFDPEAAQALFDEVRAEQGTETLELNLLTSGSPQGTLIAEFIQTSLNQFEGVHVTLETLDPATFVPRVIQGDFTVTQWGLPWRDPEPLFYSNLRSGLASNYMLYSNPVVDEAFDAARSESDLDTRAALYADAFAAIAEDVPFIPNANTPLGYLLAPQLRGGEFYEDGILRSDLIWRAE
jgi:peptide/nickel transport system substrate-binding protein